MKPYKLDITIKDYAWGEMGEDAFIKRLFNAKGNGPFAEAWIGAHEHGPSKAITPSGNKDLRELGLAPPFLFKFLAASTILSIQAHPAKERAKEMLGKQAEKIYTDANHKPEIAIPITEFWALSGFREFGAIAEGTSKEPSLRKIIEEAKDTKALFTRIMNLQQNEINSIMHPIMTRLRSGGKKFNKVQREYWLLKADEVYTKDNNYDVGMLCLYLLNLVHLVPFGNKAAPSQNPSDALHLEPGEALFTGPGILHSYLEGVIVEVMANSDNVVRAGLTHKPKFVDELIAITDFSATPPVKVPPRIIKSNDATMLTYLSSAEEFGVQHIIQDGKRILTHPSLCFLAVTQGSFMLQDKEGTMSAPKGTCLVIPPGCACTLEGKGEYYLSYEPEEGSDQKHVKAGRDS